MWHSICYVTNRIVPHQGFSLLTDWHQIGLPFLYGTVISKLPGNMCRKWLIHCFQEILVVQSLLQLHFPEDWSHVQYLVTHFMDLQTSVLSPLTHFLDLLTCILGKFAHFLDYIINISIKTSPGNLSMCPGNMSGGQGNVSRVKDICLEVHKMCHKILEISSALEKTYQQWG